MVHLALCGSMVDPTKDYMRVGYLALETLHPSQHDPHE